MTSTKLSEDLLREAAAIGDEDGVRTLINAGVDINSQHCVNGWTALHWAAKRGHPNIVRFLLSQGADSNLLSVYGDSAGSVSNDVEVRDMLCCGEYDSPDEQTTLPITPNYMRSPSLAPRVELQSTSFDRPTSSLEEGAELVLKVRTSDPPDQDFIEVEINLKELTFENVFTTCCEELAVCPDEVQKLRKLPNTIVRKDKDVLRFEKFQELELVLNVPNPPLHSNSSTKQLPQPNRTSYANSAQTSKPRGASSTLCSTRRQKPGYQKEEATLY